MPKRGGGVGSNGLVSHPGTGEILPVTLCYSLYLLELYMELHTYIAFLLTLEFEHGLFHQWMWLAPLEGYEGLMIPQGSGVVFHL